MSFNPIQFQRGMSIPEFIGRFGTEAQCAEAVKCARWPGGFRCPRCDRAEHYLVGHGARKLFQCNACRHQTSLTAGSLMEHTKLPLTTWFLAIYLISQAKTGLSALALKRQLGVSYPTAWLLHHKINRAMSRRESTHRLGGDVQLDDAYLGGERAGGKAGRGSENKVAFVAAVSLNGQGQPMYLKLNLVSGFTSLALSKWAKATLLAGTVVTSDGLGCFAAVADAGCRHNPVIVGELKPRDLPQFKWVNTVLGNLKTTLAGTFHSLKFSKYADDYLAAFAYRFNRRFDLRALIARLIVDVARCKPITRAAVTALAEARF
jgi:transposase-like protein